MSTVFSQFYYEVGTLVFLFITLDFQALVLCINYYDKPLAKFLKGIVHGLTCFSVSSISVHVFTCACMCEREGEVTC